MSGKYRMCPDGYQGDRCTTREAIANPPPFFLVDFFSVELSIVEVDAKRVFGPYVVLAPGKHSLTIRARKGPHGYFGVAPFLGTCYGTLEFDAQAEKEYYVEFKRDSEMLELVDRAAETVLANITCAPK